MHPGHAVHTRAVPLRRHRWIPQLRRAHAQHRSVEQPSVEPVACGGPAAPSALGLRDLRDPLDDLVEECLALGVGQGERRGERGVGRGYGDAVERREDGELGVEQLGEEAADGGDRGDEGLQLPTEVLRCALVLGADVVWSDCTRIV